MSEFVLELLTAVALIMCVFCTELWVGVCCVCVCACVRVCAVQCVTLVPVRSLAICESCVHPHYICVCFRVVDMVVSCD